MTRTVRGLHHVVAETAPFTAGIYVTSMGPKNSGHSYRAHLVANRALELFAFLVLRYHGHAPMDRRYRRRATRPRGPCRQHNQSQ